LEPPGGSVGIGDRNYWAPALTAALAQGHPPAGAVQEQEARPAAEAVAAAAPAALAVETVNSKLAGRFHAKRTWAQDLWHLCNRLLHKILSHTVAAWVNVRRGHRPLDFASLVTE
jgi:hypothetical protein